MKRINAIKNRLRELEATLRLNNHSDTSVLVEQHLKALKKENAKLAKNGLLTLLSPQELGEVSISTISKDEWEFMLEEIRELVRHL